MAGRSSSCTNLWGYVALFFTCTIWVFHSEILVGNELKKPKPIAMTYLSFFSGSIFFFVYPLCYDFSSEIKNNRGHWYIRRWRGYWGRIKEYFEWRFFMIFTVLSFIMELLWIWSYRGTSPAVNNTVYQANLFFTVLLSWPILKEKPTLFKWISVTLSAGGVALVVFSTTKDEVDENTIASTWWGICLVIGSAFAWALMQIFTKYFDPATESPSDPNEKPRSGMDGLVDTLVFTSSVGIQAGVSCWVFVAVLHFTGVEKFELPDSDQLLFCVIYSTSGAVYEIANNWGVFMSGPTLMAVGQVLVIPLTYLIDVLRGHAEGNWVTILGGLLCILGVVMSELATPPVKDTRYKNVPAEDLELTTLRKS